MPETRFRMGEIFRPDDPLALWVLGIALVMNDVILANRYATEAWAASGDEPSPEGLNFFRMAASHYREAAKFQQKWDRQPIVQQFIERLPTSFKEDYQAFQGSYEPWQGSFVGDALKPIRDQLFHYPEEGDDELRIALTELRHVVSSYRSDGTFATLRALFADDVASQMAPGRLPDMMAIRQTVQQLAQLMTGLIRFSEASATYFLLERGVIQRPTT